MRLRYVGAQATTFIGVGEVEPGALFDVPDDQAQGFLRRPDVVEGPPVSAPEPDLAPAAAKTRKTAKTTDQQIAAVAAPEEG